MKKQKEVNLYNMIAGTIPRLGTEYTYKYNKDKYIITGVFQYKRGGKVLKLGVKGVLKKDFDLQYWVKEWAKQDEKGK